MNKMISLKMVKSFILLLCTSLALATGSEMAGIRVVESSQDDGFRPISFTGNAATSGSFHFPDVNFRGPVNNDDVIIDESDFDYVTDESNYDINDTLDATMDLPGNMTIADMNGTSTTMEAISEIRSIEDFSRIFGLPMPAEESNFDFRPRLGSQIVDALNAVCEPENRTVVLDLPRELNVVYFPRCVRLMRCGGCCHGPLLSCQPTLEKSIKLKILKVSSGTSGRGTSTRNTPRNSGRTRTSTRTRTSSSTRSNARTRTRGSNRRRREESTAYYEIDEIQHLACSCNCRVTEKDCDMTIQTYSKDECLCRCKNEDEKNKCKARGKTHYWDPKSCSCYCYKEQSCSTGQRFDHDTCSCVRNFAARLGASGRDASGASDPETEEASSAQAPPITFNGR